MSSRLPRHRDTARNREDHCLRETVNAVPSRINSAIGQFASMASDFFSIEDTPSLDHTGSHYDDDDDDDDDDSSSSRMSLPHVEFIAQTPSIISPMSTPPRTSPTTRSTQTILGPSPMARMRNEDLHDAASLPPVVPSPPRRTGEQVIQDKHAKWRRHIQRVKKKKELAEQSLLCHQTNSTTNNTTANTSTRPKSLLEQLLRTATCAGELDDACADSYSVPESLSQSYSEGESSDDSPIVVITKSRMASPSTKGLQEPDALILDLKLNEQSQVLLSVQSSATGSISQADSQAESVVSITDKNFIKVFIHEATEGIPMMWHDAQDADPQQVLVFLEVGFLMGDGHYAGPRLAWYSQESGHFIDNMDLFDIQSLEKATTLQLDKYPFAMPGNSLILRTSAKGNDFHLVLESPNGQQAMRFVHGIRWVVARMTFNMIIGNPVVTCELLEVQSGGTESRKAMNDMTNQLIESAILQHGRQLV